jgi:sporulation protein YlmC with PRC-barrel domain
MYNGCMYVLASQLQALPVISLQTGETVAMVQQPLIDAANLEIAAYSCQVPGRSASLVLPVRDIREHAQDCLIIDAEEELTEAGELVRLRPLLEQKFTPLGKTAVTDLGRKLGRVEDFTINLDTNRIQKLYIKQSVLQSWLGSSLIVDRTQILDITPKQIVIRDTTTQAPLLAGEPAPAPKSQA